MGGDGKGGVKNDSDVSNLRGCLVLLAHVRMKKLDGAIPDSRRMMMSCELPGTKSVLLLSQSRQKRKLFTMGPSTITITVKS